MDWIRDRPGLLPGDLDRVFKYDPGSATVLRITENDKISDALVVIDILRTDFHTQACYLVTRNRERMGRLAKNSTYSISSIYKPHCILTLSQERPSPTGAQRGLVLM